jgi:hypothetical protein
MTEAHGLEVELFKVPLEGLIRNRDQELVVFRIGENRLRLVVVITSPHVAVAERNSYELDCQKAVLIPIYAHPKNQSSYSLSWKSALDDSRMMELPFKTILSLQKFQEAVTNFGVVANLSGLSAIRAKGSMLRFDGRYGTELGSKGQIQLWLYRKPPPTKRTTRQNSVASGGTTGTSSSSTLAWSHKYITKSNPASSLRSTESGGYLDPPVPAQLVLFTLHHDQLRLISIKVDENTTINPDRCDCSNSKKSKECKRIVIENDSNGSLEVKIYDTASTGASEDISKFNVALLRHPSHADAKRNVEELSFKFVTVDLESAAAREQLCDSFETAARVVRRNAESYSEDLRNLRNRHVHQEDDEE